MFARLCLALALAFVFTGRMEAAAAHCLELAAAEAAAPAAPESVPCHGAEAAAAAEMTGHSSGPEQMPAKDTCECIAVLKACSAVTAASASAHIEPYEWTRLEIASFASVDPAPGLRPPRP